jgi:predicted Na+-dependent transporter
MKLSDLFLPIGLTIAFIWALLFPTWGDALFHLSFFNLKISQVIIFFIFAISGYLLKLDNFNFDSHLLISLIGGIFINMLLAPLLALVILYYIPLNTGLKIGVLTISCVPPTMATGIITTTIAKGNITWAIIFTIVLNGIGVLIVPFTFDHIVEVDAGNKINALSILQSLFLLVLLPALIGFAIKKKWAKKNISC